ncbi:MAG TPA: HAMP domain-containing sensor histidine kinase [Candidatus Limnocylindrales bacterium]
MSEGAAGSAGGPGRPRHRPPWWPQDEEWPPRDWRGGWAGRGGRWHRRRTGFAGPFGCAVVALIVLAAGTLTIAAWAVFAITGLVNAPRPFVIFGLVALVLIALAAFRAASAVRRMSVPIDELADVAERIERGDFSARVRETGPRRLPSLARAFNQMSARLATADERRRAFLADAAHELRTPLTIIRAQIEAIEDGVHPADKDHFAPIDAQLAALERLIDNLRTVALAESGALELHRAPLDVGTAIDNAVAAFRAEADADGVELRADYPPGLPKPNADELRVGQVLANLISNALRYTAKGGHVTVSARRATDGTALEVSVRDDGQGIAPELLPHIFDRFAKAVDSPGSGLGLAICRDLVEAHGGHISIESQAGRGTTATFTLPLA